MKLTKNINTGDEELVFRTISTSPKEHFEGRWKSGRLYPLYSVVVNNGTTFVSQNAKMKEEPYVIYDAVKQEFKANDGWKIKEMSADSRLTALGGGSAGGVTPEDVAEMISGKQDTIEDLSTIRSGASAGATAYQKPNSGIPASDIASGVIPTDVVKYSLQTLTDAQKAEARANIEAQDYLVSGTNIKTVNGESILGSGNIAAGDPNAVKYTEQTLTDAQKTQSRTNIGAGTYSKPSGGIPASDIASGVIPTVPTVSTDVSADAASDVKTSSPKSVKTYVDAGIAAVESDLSDLADEVEAIDIGAYDVAWDGNSEPVVANIPAGVSVTYNTTTYTGTLAASASTIQKIYLVATGTTDNYDRYVTVGDSTYSWVNIGTTEITLADYATKTKVSQLEAELNGADIDKYNNQGEADYYKTENTGANMYYGIGCMTPILATPVTFNRLKTPYIYAGQAQRFKYAIVESSTVGGITPNQQTVIQTGTIDVTTTPTQYIIILQNDYTTTANKCIDILFYSEGTSSAARVYLKGGTSGIAVYNADSQRMLFYQTSAVENPWAVSWSRNSAGYIGPSPVLFYHIEALTSKVQDNADDIADIKSELVTISGDIADINEDITDINEDITDITTGKDETLYNNAGEIEYYDLYGGNNSSWGIGAITPLLSGGKFNTLYTPKIKGENALTLKYAIVDSSTVGGMTPSSQTIIKQGEISVTTEYAQYEIKLSSPYIVPDQHCVAILFYSQSTSKRPVIRGLSGNGTVYSESQRYLFLNSSGEESPFTVAWSRSSPNFICPSPVLKWIEPSVIQKEISDTISENPEVIAEAVMPTIEDEIVEMVSDEIREINKVSFNLAGKYYAVVGDTLQLFYQGIVNVVNIEEYDIYCRCAVGFSYMRYFEYTPTISNIGDNVLTVYVRDKNGTILGSAETTIKTVASPVSPATEKNIFTFGDSLTSGGAWPCESARRLLNTNTVDGIQGKGISNIVYRGKKTVTKNGQTTNYFGVGGWTWNSYISESTVFYFRFFVSSVNNVSIGDIYSNNGFDYTVSEINITSGTGEILCSSTASTNTPQASGTLTKVSGGGDATISYSSYELDNANPLWDEVNDKMSFIPYVSDCGATTIDAVFVLLTWNSMTSWRNYTKDDASGHIANAKTFARTLHDEYPSAKLFIMGLQMPSVTGGLGRNYSGTSGYVDWFGLKHTAVQYNMALRALCEDDEFASYCEFVDVAAQFDTLYNMPYSDVPVNKRYPNGPTEKIGTNGVHPTDRGYYQIADAVYRVIVANFCQS